MGKNRFNIAAFLPLVLAFLLSSRPGMSQQIWNPGHAIGTVSGVYNFNYTQTPSALV
jgi:hypothetical protein